MQDMATLGKQKSLDPNGYFGNFVVRNQRRKKAC